MPDARPGSRWSSTITRTTSGGTSSSTAATTTRSATTDSRARHGCTSRSTLAPTDVGASTRWPAVGAHRHVPVAAGASAASCARKMRAYRPAAAISSACVPSSSMRPSCRTTTRSAWGNAASRCEHTTVVTRRSAWASGPKACFSEPTMSGLGRDVHGRERVVQDEQPRQPRRARGDRAREAHPLALAAGEPDAGLADLRVEPSRKAADLLFQRRDPQSLRQDGVVLRLDGAAAQRHVVADGAGEEAGLLREVADEPAALVWLEAIERPPVDENLAGLDGVDAEDGARQGALAGADGPGDAHEGARGDVESEVAEGRALGAGVAERHAAQRDGDGLPRAALPRRSPGVPPRAGEVPGSKGGEPGLPGHRRGGREQGAQPRVGGRAALDRVHELRDPMAAVDEAEEQLEERDERPHRHRPGEDPPAAAPDHDDDSRDHQRRVDRLQPALEPRQGEVRIGDGSRPLRHALDRRAGPAEEAPHADGRELLLDGRRHRRRSPRARSWCGARSIGRSRARAPWRAARAPARRA